MNELRMRIAIDYADEVELGSTATVKIAWSGVDEDLNNCPDCVKARLLAALGTAGLSYTVEANSDPYTRDDAGERARGRAKTESIG